jgi:hypothetical protein
VLSQGDRPALITIQGCLDLCGHDAQLYTSEVWTNTVTTWVLPVVGGLLLQAPFESNRFWRTSFALVRWLGSLISSLSYVLWNIKVLDKCALMVDMAVGYADSPPETVEMAEEGPVLEGEKALPAKSQRTEFASMRDSFYLLSVMNQFNIPLLLPRSLSTETMLRIALFSDTLVLTEDAGYRNLPQMREALVRGLRSRRRRGTVPVFISIFWFLVSLGISINTAFGQLGGNATAHNLALGLMLGWLPIFILACIVDRNPVSTNDIRDLLNGFLDTVRLSLLDVDNQKTYVRRESRVAGQLEWLNDLKDPDYEEALKSLFRDFAGQGRTRWHYGVAHSVLAAVEDVGVAEIGRGWLESLLDRHDKLVLGPAAPSGLHYFDLNEVWQIAAAIFIVLGTLLGAFIISIFRPTVGLGCRSGGYMIYFLLALASFGFEMLVWTDINKNFEGRAAIPKPGFLRRMSNAGGMEPFMTRFRKLMTHETLERAVFIPWDIINTGWLVYIVCSQTFGLYNTGECIGSKWGLGYSGGYVDFLSVVTYKAQGIIVYWAAGTALSGAFLLVASIYIFVKWLTQSHLSTENYARAMRGLRRTRRWKRSTTWLRVVCNLPQIAVRSATSLIRMWSRSRARGRRTGPQVSRSLEWAVKPRADIIVEEEGQLLTTTSISPMPLRASAENDSLRPSTSRTLRQPSQQRFPRTRL